MNTRVVGWIAGLTLAGTALAQQAPLSGPPVEQNRPDIEERFSDAAGKFSRKDPMGNRPLPMRLYMDAVLKLRGEQAPEELRLTPEQERTIKAVGEDFRRAARAAAPKRSEGRDAAQREPAPAQPPAAGRRVNAERMQRLTADYETKIYAALRPAQQKFVNAEAHKARAEIERRAGDEYVKKQLERRGKGAASPTPAAASAAAPRERAQRLLERLRQLPPDQREEIFRMLEQELDKRGVPAARPQRDQPGDPKPAPDMDDVPLPKPMGG
jgi:hypothetical protein